MNIRKYTLADKESIIDLFRINTPNYFSIIEEKDLIYYLDNYTENYYVVELEHQLIGSGGFNFADDLEIAKISWDIFHPNYHGRGFGSKLTQFRIEKIKEYDDIKIISVRTSQLTFKFYEKFGFKIK